MKLIEKTYDEKPRKGYSLLSEVGITCVNCQVDLLYIIKVLQTNEINKIQVICPRCCEPSFITTIKGKCFTSPGPNMTIKDARTSLEKNYYKTVVELIECQT
uniref:Uncharacterized protein n=1 Tax=viral metagenome TaxID=1070528 RepID=A0A6M3IJD9_9ZZZZ